MVTRLSTFISLYPLFSLYVILKDCKICKIGEALASNHMYKLWNLFKIFTPFFS